MRIELEVLEPEERSDQPAPCWLCGRRFATGLVAAWAYSSTGNLDCGPTCPTCIEEGPAKMQERLETNARWSRWRAEDDELLASEDVESPTIEALRTLEQIAAL